MRFLCLLLLSCLFALPAWGLPDSYTEKVLSTPDLYQGDRQARLPGGGRGYCAPVAVSNSLFWLVQNGFANLLPSINGRPMTQAQLAGLLGMGKYMNTSLKNGTSPAELMHGVELFLTEQGAEIEMLAYQGWRAHQEEFSTGRSIPDLNWIKEGLLGNSGVWLNLGWYKFDPVAKTYTRVGGHWVTLVGYGIGENGLPDPAVLIVHDPAVRGRRLEVNPPSQEGDESQVTLEDGGGKEASVRFVAAPRRDRLRLEPIREGVLANAKPDIQIPAAGYFKVLGADSIIQSADTAILDGVVVLRLTPNSSLAPLEPSVLAY
ncbi:MAG: hypothetical protein QMD09_14275 [Desulfatibacillaceae bacterium]|nr:hypothetical protein [Desulfatibacillaceae bacterium]